MAGIVESTLTAGDTPACTNACTNKAENAHETPADAQGGGQGEGTAQADTGGQDNATPLESLAHAIANLSAEDRAALAAMLTQGDGGGTPNTEGPALSDADGKGGDR